MNLNLQSARGAALIDVLFTCGFITTLAAVAIPSLQASRERDAAVMAAQHLASRFSFLRMEAIRRNAVVAMRFDPEDPGRTALYADGDGDGVSQGDVDSGTDPAISAESHIGDQFPAVRAAIPRALPAPDGHHTLAADSDPIRIGSTNFVSFSPLGTSTSGTIYVTSRAGTQACVRLFGATGRMRILEFDRGRGVWRHR